VADDLRRRPPERLGVDDGAAGVHVGAQIARHEPGQQKPAQNRAVGRRPDVRSGIGGDRGRDRVRLLRGETALLRTELRCVSGGVDVRRADDAALQVGRHEAAAVVREPRHCRPDELRQRDNSIRLDRTVARDLEHPVAPRDRRRPELELDAAKLEQLGDGRARFAAEDRERVLLRRHDHELDPARAVIAQVRAGLQGELVQRERPAHAGRNDEREPPHVTGRRLLEERDECRTVLWASEGQGSDDGISRARTDGEHERVVLDGVAARELDALLRRLDAGKAVRTERRPGRVDQRLERKAANLVRSKRLRHCQRAVGELGLRSDELDLHQLSCERTQSQCGLQRGDSGAGDHDVERRAAGVQRFTSDARGSSYAIHRGQLLISVQRGAR
jgi:hypothetical protein